MISLVLTFTGCMSWNRGWTVPRFEAALPHHVTMQEADTYFEQADSKEKLLHAISLYEAIDPGIDALKRLDRLAEAYILMGAAYAQSREEKRDAYHLGIQFAEQALWLNPEFRTAMASGNDWDVAVQNLNMPHMTSMLLWVTGVSYLYKECLSGLGHVWHFRWVEQSRSMLDRMAQLDPYFEYGAVLFSQAIFDIALPKSAGGDLQRASERMDAAVAASQGSLLIRWGSAKYLHVRTQNREAMITDLNWVVAQDPKAAPSPYPWNVYFQRDAKQMLAKLDPL